jgi:hypothetical protein
VANHDGSADASIVSHSLVSIFPPPSELQGCFAKGVMGSMLPLGITGPTAESCLWNHQPMVFGRVISLHAVLDARIATLVVLSKLLDEGSENIRAIGSDFG